MVTKSYLPSYLCDSRDGTDSGDSSDGSDRSDKKTRQKTASVKTNFFTKKLVHNKMFSPKIVFDQKFLLNNFFFTFTRKKY